MSLEITTLAPLATMQISMAHSLLKEVLHSSLSSLFHPHALASWLGARQQGPTAIQPSLPTTTEAWLSINADHQGRADELDPDARYWWASSGLALAVLLDRAGYSSDAQHRLLAFIRAVVPSLGAGHLPRGRQRWKSFMTDDHTPIELSWDWRAGPAAAPKVRFSIEPVGVRAGTRADPRNQHAAPRLREVVARLLPHADMAWLGHFHRRLVVGGEGGEGGEAPAGAGPAEAEGHPSREFYAFDLGGDGSVMSKAYFFPGPRARAARQSSLAAVRDAIRTAPGCAGPEELRALRVLEAYAADGATPPLEVDMLAVDLVGPAASRFKIYFRVRDTSFASVRDAMSLGGRVRTPELDRGLEALRRLYRALLGPGAGGQAPEEDGAQLPARDHRTAGILYNAEFRYGSESPKVKAYLPVRHYAQSEEAIMSALGAHFNNYNNYDDDDDDDDTTESSAGWRANVANYTDAVRTIL